MTDAPSYPLPHVGLQAQPVFLVDADGEVYEATGGGSGGSGDASATNQLAGNVLLGAVTETAPATDTASSGLNGRLQRIAQRITSFIALLPASLGQKARAASLAVTLSSEDQTTQAAIATSVAAGSTAANQTAQTTLFGGVTETAPATDTASSGLNGRLQRIAQRVTSLIALFPTALGRAAAASSFAVALSTEDKTALDAVATATKQDAAAVLLGAVTETAPATDTASSGLNGRLQRIAQRVTSLIALVPASLGQKAKAAALAVTLASDEDLLTYTGGVTETAPATDTASSGLNGRLQRIAQRITSLIALIPTSLGAKAAASSFAVGLATDDPLTVAFGSKGDSVASSDTGTFSLIALTKRLLQYLGDTTASATYPKPTTPVSGLTAAMTGVTSTPVTGMGAPASLNFNYITQITVGNSHATVGTFVELQDGSGGATFYTIPAAAVYGGATLNFATPLKQPTAATALYAKNTTSGANVIVSASGFTATA